MHRTLILWHGIPAGAARYQHYHMHHHRYPAELPYRAAQAQHLTCINIATPWRLPPGSSSTALAMHQHRQHLSFLYPGSRQHESTPHQHFALAAVRTALHCLRAQYQSTWLAVQPHATAEEHQARGPNADLERCSSKANINPGARSTCQPRDRWGCGGA
jgi:hypothetical protein